MGIKDLSPGGKCCLACCVVTVVALGVMVPVGIFVIGPNVAQHVLDQSTVALPNLTQVACTNQYVWLHNHAEITVPKIGPIGVTSNIQSFTQEVWTTACVNEKTAQLEPGAACGGDDKEYHMGTYSSPAMTLSAGKNADYFAVTMDANTTVVVGAWVQGLWLTADLKPGKTRLILTAKDVSVKVMGLTFSGLTMRNELTCTGVPINITAPQVQIPNSVCYPQDPKHEATKATAFMATCVVGRHDIAEPTTTPAATTTTKKNPVTTTTKEASLILA